MNKYITILLLLFLYLKPLTTNGQQSVLDSLKAEIIKNPKQDSFRVKAIVDYVIEGMNNNTSDFLPYMNDVIMTSKIISYRKGLQKGYMIGQIYFSDCGDYEKAFLYADSAFEVLKGDTTLNARQNLGHLYNNIAGDYIKLGDYEKATENYTASAKIFEPMNHPFLATVYSGFAEVYERINESSKAIEFDKMAIAIAEKNGNNRLMAGKLLNYSMRLINKKDFTNAAAQLKKAEPIIIKLENTSYLLQFFYSTGYVEQNSKHYTKAIENYMQALNYAAINKDVYQQTNVLDALSVCLIEMNKMKEAKLYLDTLLKVATESNLKIAQRSAYLNLAKWFTQKSDYKNANIFLQKSIAISDSMLSGDIKEKIAAQEVRYQVEKKQTQIKQLQTQTLIQQISISKKNTINYLLGISAVAILIISLLSYRSYNAKQKMQRQKIEVLETEKQLTATEAVLKGEEKERTRLAKDLHDGLGGMLSGIKHSFQNVKGNLILTPDNALAFERSMDMLDSSIKEMRRVAHNMMPETLVKYGLNTALKDFCKDINQSGAIKITYQSVGMEATVIEQTASITIFRIVQELVNNIIKHAAANEAVVQLNKLNEQLSITVEDDGKGFNTVLLKESKGMGWANIENRVEFLKGNLDIQSESGKGTSVHIEMNV